MRDKNAALRSELTPIVNDAFKRASSAQQCALPDPAPFVDAIIAVVERYRANDTFIHGYAVGLEDAGALDDKTATSKHGGRPMTLKEIADDEERIKANPTCGNCGKRYEDHMANVHGQRFCERGIPFAFM